MRPKLKRDLRSRLHRSFGVLLVGLALMGLVSVAGSLANLRAINELIDESQPLLEKNAAFRQLLTDAQSAQRAYRLTRDERFLRSFLDAVEAVPEVESELRVLSASQPEIWRLLAVQVDRAETWLNIFSLPLLTRVQQDPTYAPDGATTDRGAGIFEQIQTANDDVRLAIRSRADSIEREVRLVTFAATGVSAMLLVLGLAAGALISRRTTAFVANPLDDVRQTIEHLSEGDLTARSAVEGPPEIQAVAIAVNEMAESREQFQVAQQTALAQMKELDRARADFVSSVSHELRTPLTSVTGYAEMLLDGDAGDLTEEQTKMVSTIDRNARRLLALVEDILTVAKLEAGAEKLALEPVDISELVHAAAEAVRPQVRAKSLELDLDVPPLVGTVRGDRAQLERVMLNLLSNAVKFTPDHGKITLGAGRHVDRLTLTVSDTGFGIPVAEQSRMFERFFRSSTSRDQVTPGTGLGLTIVKSIVEAHGGTIDFHSTPGRGTTFIVELPVQDGAIRQTGPA